MGFQQFRRADGLLYFVAPSGQVYEVRPVDLVAPALEQAADDGYLTRLASPAVSDRADAGRLLPPSASPPPLPDRRRRPRLRLAT